MDLPVASGSIAMAQVLSPPLSFFDQFNILFDTSSEALAIRRASIIPPFFITFWDGFVQCAEN